MTAPFQTVLGLIPKGVMAGLFVSSSAPYISDLRSRPNAQWYMGTDALLSSGVTAKLLFLISDPRAIAPEEPLRRVRKSRIALFALVQLLGFGATFAITQVSESSYWWIDRRNQFDIQTIAAIGFAVIIVLLIPVRLWIIPRMPFSEDELDILDGPVASPFVSTGTCHDSVGD
jgi:hypothetical protein